nr:hypothetical protein [Paenibacillus methanolicus]
MNESAFSELLVSAFTEPMTWLATCWISLAVFAEFSASLRISSATTAKPLPASPARAASIAALSASKFVRDVISRIESVSTWICSTAFACSIAALESA